MSLCLMLTSSNNKWPATKQKAKPKVLHSIKPFSFVCFGFIYTIFSVCRMIIVEKMLAICLKLHEERLEAQSFWLVVSLCLTPQMKTWRSTFDCIFCFNGEQLFWLLFYFGRAISVDAISIYLIGSAPKTCSFNQRFLRCIDHFFGISFVSIDLNVKHFDGCLIKYHNYHDQKWST